MANDDAPKTIHGLDETPIADSTADKAFKDLERLQRGDSHSVRDSRVGGGKGGRR